MSVLERVNISEDVGGGLSIVAKGGGTMSRWKVSCYNKESQLERRSNGGSGGEVIQ
jgi:hypothetical protein